MSFSICQRPVGGLAEDVFPFSFTVLLSAVAAGTSLAFLTAVPTDDERWLRISSGFALWLFTWTLLSVVSLVAVVYEYGEVRASAVPGGSWRWNRTAEPIW